jgi:hypothetical protein
MKWEHIFAFTEGGMVLRHEGVRAPAAAAGPKFPMSVTQYITELGANDGYEFAGSYHQEGGMVIVMKRQQAQM